MELNRQTGSLHHKNNKLFQLHIIAEPLGKASNRGAQLLAMHLYICIYIVIPVSHYMTPIQKLLLSIKYYIVYRIFKL